MIADDFVFNYKIDESKNRILGTILDNSKKLSEYFYVYNGAKPYEVGKGTPPQTKEIQKNKIYNGYTKIDDSWVPYMRGKRIHRFTNMWDGEYIKYGENLAAPRSADIFFREKIFVRQTGDKIIATLDNNNVSNDTLHIIYPKNNNVNNSYLLGILNSELMTWIYQAIHPTEVGKPMAQVKKGFIEDLPLIIAERNIMSKLENIVDVLLEKCQNRHNIGKEFNNYIMKVYEPKKITEAMLRFQYMPFKIYLFELKKQGVKLSAKEQMELLKLYEECQEEINILSREIEKKYNELNEIVFVIYGISKNDAEYIKNNIHM